MFFVKTSLMKGLEVRDSCETIIESMTEEEFANFLHEEGAQIFSHQGRYWKATYPGFYQPIHWMARLRAEEVTRPKLLSWGFQGTLCEDDAAFANSSLPVHFLPNLVNYDLKALTSKRRNKIKKCRNLVQIVELTGPKILQEQGYEVLLSSIQRTGYGKIPSKEQYLAGLSNYILPKRRFIIAGLIDGKLGGYITGYAINGSAYMEITRIATEALSTNIGTGLGFEFIQICRRSQQIYELINGLYSREDKNLCVFKEEMGFEVAQIPAKLEINPLMAKFIRWRYPDKYYRLHGHD